jgi:CubicO group peptidase (beta-lactamase class C family)
MTSTLVRDDPTRVVPGRPTGYRALPEGGYRIYSAWALAAGLPGSTGIYSTLGDLARWDANFFDERVGGAGITEAMYTRARLTSGDTIAYASGLYVREHRGLRTVWHGGLGTGSSEILRFPEQRLSVAVLCNSNVDSYGLATSVADLYLAEQMDAASAAAADLGPPRLILGEAELARFAGTYVILENGQVVEYVVADGALAAPEDNGVWPMVALGEGRFEDEWIRIEFAPDAREAILIDKATRNHCCPAIS